MPTPPDETSLAETGLQSGSAGPASGSGQSGSRAGWLSSSGPGGGQEALSPGTLLAERYRILGLVGRGGMGEVYRAEDLRLGQHVALKFLPAAVAGDPQRLAQFHHEVRIARQVSHRNVCRVYDIGEDHGRVFLTMELVDGEDLAALLKRVGRFPEERATEIARQICAGLAAAHECGVLHRDLKPANIMLDAEGRVRITDFGLAGLVGSFTDIRSGTPAYMAPEQLAGRDVSERSDLFSLGLVLFEIYTGKRAFDAGTIAELLRQHDEGVRLSSGTSGRPLEAAVERVIQRCLEREPAARPSSAIMVSAALPGGDPLAAALAAGETPSPAMVAAAGRKDAVPLPYGVMLIALIVVGLGGLIALRNATSFYRFMPVDLSPAVLEDRARQVIAGFGYRDKAADTVGQLFVGNDYLSWRRTQPAKDRWTPLASGRAPAVGYWFRTSPTLIVPLSDENQPTSTDPPLRTVGMTFVSVDASGALLDFQAVPPQRLPPAQAAATPPAAAAPATAAPAPASIDWQPVFDAVRWPGARFTPATPEWTPPVATDTRAAWTGTIPEMGTTPLRLEAGTFGGRIVWVQTIGPWTKAGRDAPARPALVARILETFKSLLVLFLMGGSALLARRMAMLGRGDRRGATRVALVLFVLGVARWAAAAHHVPDYSIEQEAFFDACARALFPAGVAWLAYLGIEPWIRRHWPTSLISWSRILGGAVRDPLVGRDVLIGVAFGLAGAIYPGLVMLIVRTVGDGVTAPEFNGVWTLTQPRFVVATLLSSLSNGLFDTLLMTLLYVVVRRLVRWPWLAAVTTIALLTLVIASEDGVQGWLGMTWMAGLSLLIVLPLARYGLLPSMVAFCVRQVLLSNALTPDLGAWYASGTWIIGGVIIAIAITAFLQSRAGAPTFGRLLEE
jgi:serine/threonine-protein kinase